MDFRLAFTPKPFPVKITYPQQLMLVGSCFTENIGDKLMAHKFSVLQNPHGILFNPVSVKEAFESYTINKQITADSLFYLNEAWHSWQHHSRFSAPGKEEAVQKINASVSEAHAYLKKAEWLIITYGSAWVYALTNLAANAVTGNVAANNHKAPANWFNRRLLSNEALQAVVDTTIRQLQQFNPSLKIIFTISPVRHLREGFVENNRSKAALINAVHNAVEHFTNVFYFPAYELVIDDLRDYRFYAEDMVHPNYAATNYVWDKFVTACMDKDAQELMEQINEINAAVNHKAFNPASAAHKKFVQGILDKMDLIKAQHPYIDFSAEKNHFSLIP
ncbi:MAG: GSCFA domain-containing protein [Ferruginibacter sp.]